MTARSSCGGIIAEAHSNRGDVLHKLKRFDDALASCDRALTLRPDYAEAHSNRGNALARATAVSTKRWQVTTARWRCGRTIAEAHSNRGNALRELNRSEAGAGELRPRARAAAATLPRRIGNRGSALCRS